MSRCQITTTHTCIHVYKKVQVVDHITTVNHTHVYTHDPMKSNWADYAVHVIRNCVGTHQGNKLTNNSSGNACPVISAHWATVVFLSLETNACKADLHCEKMLRWGMICGTFPVMAICIARVAAARGPCRHNKQNTQWQWLTFKTVWKHPEVDRCWQHPRYASRKW